MPSYVAAPFCLFTLLVIYQLLNNMPQYCSSGKEAEAGKNRFKAKFAIGKLVPRECR